MWGILNLRQVLGVCVDNKAEDKELGYSPRNGEVLHYKLVQESSTSIYYLIREIGLTDIWEQIDTRNLTQSLYKQVIRPEWDMKPPAGKVGGTTTQSVSRGALQFSI